MIFNKVSSPSWGALGDFEQIVFCSDSKVGLKAIVGVHSTILGPATGGCRMWNYANEEAALEDVLRLSRGMTYKASVAGLNWGGGKSVIWADPKTAKTPALLERFGEMVNNLGGTYVTAKDVGIGSEDLKIVKRKTKHVLGIDGEPGSSGDPSPATAWGVYHGMKAAAKFATGASNLGGMKIALQGLGSVSYSLLEHVIAEGAKVVGCDVDPKAIERAVSKYGIEIVSPDAIYDVPCDIFSPSALGSSISSQTRARIKAKIVAGAANNQLATPEDGNDLDSRGIVYAPDYVINGGGLINIYYEAQPGGYVKSKAFEHVTRIGETMKLILERARAEKTPSYIIADRVAEERILRAKGR